MLVSSDKLADALWGEQPPESWSKVVAGCVMRLRRALGAETIETTPHGYRLAMLTDDLDVSRFEQSVAKGRELLTLGETERAAFVLGEALALWRGRALIDAENWEPSQIEATRLEQTRLDAEELRVDASLQSGSTGRCSPKPRHWSPASRYVSDVGHCWRPPSIRPVARARH